MDYLPRWYLINKSALPGHWRLESSYREGFSATTSCDMNELRARVHVLRSLGYQRVAVRRRLHPLDPPHRAVWDDERPTIR